MPTVEVNTDINLNGSITVKNQFIDTAGMDDKEQKQALETFIETNSIKYNKSDNGFIVSVFDLFVALLKI